MFSAFSLLSDHGNGILQPLVTELIIDNVHVDETLTALDIAQFDTGLIVATSYGTDGLDANGITTSAWGRIRDPDVSTATLPVNETSTYAVSLDSVTGSTTAKTAKGRALIYGQLTLAKVGSAAHVAGQGLTPSMATVGTLAPTKAQTSTLDTAAHLRKIVAMCVTTQTAATAVVHFNGFGWGFALKNVAYNAD